MRSAKGKDVTKQQWEIEMQRLKYNHRLCTWFFWLANEETKYKYKMRPDCKGDYVHRHYLEQICSIPDKNSKWTIKNVGM